MNQTIETILNRRSVRVYSEEQIREEDLELILKAGLYAPSGCNMQSWHFTVVQNKEVMKKINRAIKDELLKSDNEYFKSFAAEEESDIFHNAPSIIVISGEKSALVPQIDCSAATENMMIAAESLGIGTCWIGLAAYLFKSENCPEYAKMLEVPEGYEPYYAMTLGYKMVSNPVPQPRRENTVNYIK